MHLIVSGKWPPLRNWRAMEITKYVALCTQLSRFVQLQALADDDAALLCTTCKELSAFYEREEMQQQQTLVPNTTTSINSFSLLGGVSSTTMDDIVLLTIQKLLLGVVVESEARVKESVFQVLARIFARCALKIRAFTEQKLLGFLQSCVLYLPTPDAALEPSKANEQQQRQPVSRSLQIQSEELRLHILTCLQLLLSYKAPDMHLSIGAMNTNAASASEQAHFFAYLVSALLHIGEHDKCRLAAKLAMETLELVMDFVHDAMLLRQFFPGVSVGIWKTINAPQQSSKVVVAALRCFAQSMKLCISDTFNQNAADATSGSAFTIEALRELTQQRVQEEPREQGKAVAVDTWLDETAVNIDIIFSKLFGSQIYQKSWRIRGAMVELCGAVVLSCRVTLRDSFFRCYEELLVFRVDPISEVAASAQEVIGALQQELSTDEWLRMVPVLADRFQMHLSTLSLKCSTDHESASVSIMRKLIGYVSFLGHRLGSHLDASMDSIFAALCRIMEFDAIDIDLVLHQKLIDEAGGEQEKNVLTTSQFQKRLRFFHEEESVKAATQLLHAIGSVSTPALFIDCAFMLLSNDAAVEGRGAEVFLVLNGFLKAYVKKSPVRDHNERAVSTAHQLLPSTPHTHQSVDVHLVGRILEDLLVLDTWREQQSSQKQRKTLKAEVSQRALMVECIGICVEILHRDFDVFLLHTLYPLVEKLGSQDVEVEHATLGTLHKVYFFCGYASMEALFEANMDYFVDALCSRLEHLEEFPLTGLVVEGLLRHTKIASLPLVDEVANSLLRSVDLYQDSLYISSLLRALKLLLSSMTAGSGTFQKSRPNAAADVFSGGSGPMVKEHSGSLLKQFIKEIRILSNESTFEDDEPVKSGVVEVDDEEEEELSDEAKMKGAMPVEYDERSALDGPGEDQNEDDDSSSRHPKSPYTMLIIEILDRSGHFLSESDPIACCLVLSIIEEGVLLLRDSRKELLPLIHRIWGAILHRLEVTNKPILTATIRLINTLAVLAGDFIGERFVENVWPALRKHLKSIELKEKNTATQLTRSMLLLSVEGKTDGDGGGNSSDQISQPANTIETESQTRRTQDSQLLLASLECLATVCGKSSAVTFIVPEVAVVSRKYLNAQLPLDIVQAAKHLFTALGELNGDEVFCALAPLADWKPPPPPSTRFPKFTAEATKVYYRAHGVSVPAASRDSAVYRENAEVLIKQLLRNH